MENSIVDKEGSLGQLRKGLLRGPFLYLELVGGGLLLLGAVYGISVLSHSFVFGVGHAERPILSFLTLYGLGCAATWVAFRSVRRQVHPTGRNRRIVWIIAVSLLARFLLFPSSPIQETDPNRYLWDGNATLHGVNPYLYAPAQVGREAFTDEALKTWAASTQSQEAQQLFRRINYPEVRTIYPPLAQGLFALAQKFSPWSLLGWRTLVLLADLASLGLILWVLLRVGLRPEWVLLYGWSPLILKEFSNSLHVDVFVVLMLSLMMLVVTLRRFRLAFVMLAFAGLVKVLPLILIAPLFGWVWGRNPKHAVQGTWLAGLTLLVGYLPFFSAGPLLFDGLLQFASRWRVNESLYALLAGFISQGLDNSGYSLAWAAQAGVAAVMGLVTVGVTLWLMRKPDLNHLWAGMLGITTTLFLLLPTGNPWYFTWVFPFLIVVPVQSLIWLSGVLGLYYLDFYFMYQGIPHGFQYVRLAEYGSFACLGAWGFLRWHRRSRLSSRLLTNVPSSAVPSPI